MNPHEALTSAALFLAGAGNAPLQLRSRYDMFGAFRDYKLATLAESTRRRDGNPKTPPKVQRGRNLKRSTMETVRDASGVAYFTTPRGQFLRLTSAKLDRLEAARLNGRKLCNL